MFLFNGSLAGRTTPSYQPPTPTAYIPTWWDKNPSMKPLKDLIWNSDLNGAENWVSKNWSMLKRFPYWADNAAFEAAMLVEKGLMDYFLQCSPKSTKECHAKYCEQAQLKLKNIIIDGDFYGVRNWVSRNEDIMKKTGIKWAEHAAQYAIDTRKKDMMEFFLSYVKGSHSEYYALYHNKSKAHISYVAGETAAWAGHIIVNVIVLGLIVLGVIYWKSCNKFVFGSSYKIEKKINNEQEKVGQNTPLKPNPAIPVQMKENYKLWANKENGFAYLKKMPVVRTQQFRQKII